MFLSMLKPSWLCMGVAECLLHNYDDQLLAGDRTFWVGQPLTLRKIVSSSESHLPLRLISKIFLRIKVNLYPYLNIKGNTVLELPSEYKSGILSFDAINWVQMELAKPHVYIEPLGRVTFFHRLQ